MSATFTVWIDADATPRPVRDLLLRAALKRKVAMRFVANRPIDLTGAAPSAQAVQVPGGPDVADDYIAAHCARGDLVITADIPLAARVIERGAEVLNPSGHEIGEEEIGERLSIRDFMEDLRSAGVQTSGPPPFGAAQAQRFANALDRHLARRGR